MKLPLFLVALGTMVSLADSSSDMQRCMALIEEAQASAKNAPQKAIELYQQALPLSIKAQLPAYADHIGAQLCYHLYAGGNDITSAEKASAIAKQLESIPRNPSAQPSVAYLEVLGFVDRGYEAEGKISQALDTNAKIAQIILRQNAIDLREAHAIRADDLLRVPMMLWGCAIRNMHREAMLQSYLGKNVDSVARLDELHDMIFTQKRPLHPNSEFYLAKALANRAEEMDFLGYHEAAIAAEEELIAWRKRRGHEPQYILNLQLNHLRNLSQWHGPSQQYIDQFKQLAATEENPEARKNSDRLLAKMEAALQNSQEIQARLDAVAANQTKRGSRMEALYAERDALLNRTDLSKEDLRKDFEKLLATMRLQGNLRGICSLKHEYGDYLASRGEFLAAITVLHDSLADAKRFRWTMRSVSTISSLMYAYADSSNHDGCRAMMAELSALLQQDGVLLGKSRLLAHFSLFAGHCHFSEKDLAEQQWQAAKLYATGLPAYQGRFLTEKIHDQYVKEMPSSTAPNTLPGADAISLQPVSKFTHLPAGKTGKTCIEVCNHTAQSLTVSVSLSGPFDSANASTHETLFRSGKNVSIFTFPLTIGAGSSVNIPVHFTPSGEEGSSDINCKVSWSGKAQAHEAQSSWQIRWGKNAISRTVIDASSLHNDLFRAVSVWHQFHYVGFDNDERMPFRLRSSIDRRIEYYTADDQLLAIDNNGNGDFTEEGDMAITGRESTIVALARDQIHARIYPSAAALNQDQSTLVAEVKRGSKWIAEAENTISW